GVLSDSAALAGMSGRPGLSAGGFPGQRGNEPPRAGPADVPGDHAGAAGTRDRDLCGPPATISAAGGVIFTSLERAAGLAPAVLIGADRRGKPGGSINENHTRGISGR